MLSWLPFLHADLPRGTVNEILRFQSATERIPKTMRQGRSRLVFVAGLEGTGHHAWTDMFKECINSNKCEVEANLTSTLMRFDHVKHIVHGLFGAVDSRKNADQLHKVMESMQALAARPGDHLYLIGLCFVHLSAMMSYPNYNGMNKPLDHPDISVLAAIAEWAGLDFRVIVLQRDAEEILNSTARRSIGGNEEPKVLVDNAAALYAQMQLIDRKFYHCVQYRKLGHLNQSKKDKLVDFLHPTLLTPIMDKMLTKVKYSGNKSRLTLPSFSRQGSGGSARGSLDPQENEVSKVVELSRKYHVWQLAQRLHLIDQLCQQ